MEEGVSEAEGGMCKGPEVGRLMWLAGRRNRERRSRQAGSSGGVV